MATRARKTKAETHETPILQGPEADAIALRAYEIYESGDGGDPMEHWLRAEQELATAMTLQG